MPVYVYKRREPCHVPGCEEDHQPWNYVELMGSVHDPVPVPEGEGWVRHYGGIVFGKVSGVGDSPARVLRD